MIQEDSTPEAKKASLIDKKTIAIFLGIFSLSFLVFVSFRQQLFLSGANSFSGISQKTQDVCEMSFGFDLGEYQQMDYQIQPGDALGPILVKQGLDHESILKIVENAKGVFDISKFRAGRDLHFFHTVADKTARYLVYEPSPFQYLTVGLVEPFAVVMHQRPVTTDVVTASGILETNFWNTMRDNGISPELADGLIDALESSVDFHHQQVGDNFRVQYQQHFVEGSPVGVGDIYAAMYERNGEKSYVFRYSKDGNPANADFFDQNGRQAKNGFLKAPVKFSRISSNFSTSRFHPVLRYSRPHFGTDYAAPHGTPILAIANGTVTEATRRGGNGNYVRIRHDGAYESQYLHMSRFADGVRPGKSVKQGDVIGYVGSTGLATGPHVCFRFWKNGQQVDFTKQKLPAPVSMTPAEMEKFTVYRDSMMEELAKIPLRTQEEIYKENTAKINDKKIKA